MRALEVKEEFVASVSHELRTPLTSIHGFTSLVLERDDLPDEVVHQLGVVERNVDRLDRLVADLLQTAQVERGLVHLERERTDIAGSGPAVGRGGPARGRAGRPDPGRPACPKHLVVMVDPQRFAQVVDNLVSNAVKYTPAGGRIEVDLSVTHDRVELVVLDTGIGISMRDRNHVFSRFFRTRQAAQQSIQGIGLGPEHHQGDRGQPRRPDRGRERGRPRLDVPGPAAAGRAGRPTTSSPRRRARRGRRDVRTAANG